MIASVTDMPVGDDPAFDRLIDANRQRLWGIAYAVLRSTPDAEDAIQETLICAWRAWSRVPVERVTDAWLLKICVNRSIDYRRRRLRRSTVNLLSDTVAAVDPALHGGMLDLDRAFRKLSRRQRAAVVLHKARGYTIDECAELMGCSRASVRTHYERAIRRLRNDLSEP